MSKPDKTDKFAMPPQRVWHGTHHEWGYRPEAFLWSGRRITAVNLVPLAGEMRAWMQQRGSLSIVPEVALTTSGPRNPYTLSGNALVLILANVINNNHALIVGERPLSGPIEAEIERLRSYNEVVLYCARICEVLIKQLLFCTQFPRGLYEKKSLGELLEMPCRQCKRENGKQPHMMSLLGSLAHPFHLCLEFEHCAMDHMAFVNTLRNSKAAHSSIEALDIRTAAQSMDALEGTSREVLEGFLHMLSHLEKLEDQIFQDLSTKGAEIEHFRRMGVAASEANFKSTPNQPLVLVQLPPK